MNGIHRDVIRGSKLVWFGRFRTDEAATLNTQEEQVRQVVILIFKRKTADCPADLDCQTYSSGDMHRDRQADRLLKQVWAAGTGRQVKPDSSQDGHRLTLWLWRLD